MVNRPTATVLIPGLLCSPRLFAQQIPALWRHGPVHVADHTRADSMQAIAASVLAHAPLQFNLVGLSMGGYVAFEILRQAPERVLKLALLDTSARPDTPEQTERRQALLEVAREANLTEVNDRLWPVLVHSSRQSNKALRVVVDAMATETGTEAFIRQQTAVMNRPDSRPTLPGISGSTLVVVGDEDQIAPHTVAQEMADEIPGARLEVLASCGHLSALERPEAVTRLLLEFFSGDDGR
jgi:pimeloyl-ACP methyl ester carboxylesterase